MNINDLLNKSGQVNIDALKNNDGKIDMEKLDELIENKPLVPRITAERATELSVKINRDRMLTLPDRLPTVDIMPFPVDIHEQIGNYESKHNLYLLIAHSYNKLIEEFKKLEQRIEALESKK